MSKTFSSIVLLSMLCGTAICHAQTSGEDIYKSACFACHATGVAGAPKLGDKAAWKKRIEQGMEALYTNSINGKNAMPPKGGAVNSSDDEIKAAVDYMVEASK